MPRRLVVFSDPGGAKPCLTLAEQWAAVDDVLVCSDRQYAFFTNFSVPVTAATVADAKRIIDSFDPDLLYTGTSYTSAIEVAFLRETLIRGIPSAAFVDHYTGFQSRFGGFPPAILPTEVHVIDDRAFSIAVDNGIPPGIVRVTGNPYHAYLRTWKSSLTKHVLFCKLGIPVTSNPTILFAPDPLTRAGGRAVFGTDEAELSILLCQSLSNVHPPYRLLIKPHPNQPIDILIDAMRYAPAHVPIHWLTASSEALLNDIIQHVTVVIGALSNILVEAELLGTKTLRLAHNLKHEFIFNDGCGELMHDTQAVVAALLRLSCNRSDSKPHDLRNRLESD